MDRCIYCDIPLVSDDFKEDRITEFRGGHLHRNCVQGMDIRTKEVCICAAVINPLSGEAIRCHRHADGMSVIFRQNGRIVRIKQHHQGFITSLNRFVGREEGYGLQAEAGIKSIRPQGYQTGTLFSEDLY